MTGHILDFARGFRLRIAMNAYAGIMRVLAGLGFVAFSKRAVDIATGAVQGHMPVCIALLVAAVVVELVCSAVSTRSSELAEAGLQSRLQQKLFSTALSAGWSGREVYHSGDVMSRLTEDCRVAAEYLARTVPALITALAQFAGAFLFLCLYSPLLAVLLACILPLFIVCGKMFFRRSRSLTRRLRDIESRLHATMQESLQHRLLLITCRHVAATIDVVAALLKQKRTIVRKRSDISVFSRTAVFTGFEAGYLAAFLWGIRGLRNGSVSFGLMTAYLQLAGQIQRPMAELARLLPGVSRSHEAFARLAELSSLPAQPLPEPGTPLRAGSPPSVAFRNVSFSYPDSGENILDGFNHVFEAGTATAIVGATGVGKSTLLRLVLGILSPRCGEVVLTSHAGEVAVSSSTLDSIIYVPQGNSLLSGTISSNLRIGKPDATEQEMKEALHAAAADFVFDLKHGLLTPCGEHGDGLSEGQARRIAIARGLLRPGSILLLDEISASLDEATEALLMQRLSEKKGAHTILMVTHSNAVLPYFDRVLRLPVG